MRRSVGRRDVRQHTILVFVAARQRDRQHANTRTEQIANRSGSADQGRRVEIAGPAGAHKRHQHDVGVELGRTGPDRGEETMVRRAFKRDGKQGSIAGHLDICNGAAQGRVGTTSHRA